MKKSFFFRRPVIGGLIAMIIVMVICNAIGGIAMISTAFTDLKADVRAGVYSDVDIDDLSAVRALFRPYLDRDRAQTAFNGTVSLAALICLPVFCLLNRKNGYRGPFRTHGRNLKDVKIFIAVFVLLDIATTLVYLFTLPGGFPEISVSFSMTVLALYAGINEEIIDRAIPAAVMMRNKPAPRRIAAVVLLTSVIFGAGHILNLFAGQDAATTVIQMIFAAGAGLFFAAIYLRTGSVTLTIAIHALHDLLVFITESVPAAETSLAVNGVFALLVNAAPVVFGIVMLLPRHHQGIIDTWARIWPEKNAPAATEGKETAL